MENKNVGLLIIGISVILGAIVGIFNNGLKRIVDVTCSHGSECSMYSTITIQTMISLAIAGVIFIIGVIIMLSKPKQKIIVKKVRERKKRIDLKNLERDERKVIETLQKENGAMFQRTLMEKLEIGKVKTTRLLDKLESKGLVERKRRGMNNIVVLR